MSRIGNKGWQAYTPLGFHTKGRRKYLGNYDTALEAARARRDYMLEHSAHAINPEETDESDADGDDDDDDDDEASVPPLPGDDKLEQSNRSDNTSGNSPPNIHILVA